MDSQQLDIGKGVISFFPFERSGCILDHARRSIHVNVLWQASVSNTYNHLINKDSQSPPIDGSRMSLGSDNFRSNVFCTTFIV